ncbi:pteridine-dependent deoxygenase [Coralloluteibacterium stylophorae]|uniref:Pteridine-dependent deoxygenase n=1 Tax=Coralloluteibacterium stylophorae TaxID=1776034 RepID=A0AAP2G257_9GAMM|nr:pteridine-dependent deoxygenase [Coralloluteibacterium stylophorae]MBS7458745.1 pteridine-dependent deoxygenase [Coralloluteibacterium stylophorae]
MNAAPLHAAPALRIDYVAAAPEALLAQADVLAVFGFGATPAAAPADPRWLHVALPAIGGPAPCEVWRSSGRVRVETAAGLRFAHDGRHAFAAIEVVEGAAGGIEAASEAAYARLMAFLGTSGFAHPLRIWNYLDAITEGEGDAERYRQFCVGRARGLGEVPGQFAAATAIGRQRAATADSVLQVYVLAAREPGLALENPRQVSAYRYPRQYGPQPPSFARAMLAPGVPLMFSGTASVVGHATAHVGDVLAQTRETLVNLQSLVDAGRTADAARAERLQARAILKVYVREPAQAAAIEALLRERLPDAPLLLFAADICRSDLLLEIDGFGS